jgi:hypothetical protein
MRSVQLTLGLRLGEKLTRSDGCFLIWQTGQNNAAASWKAGSECSGSGALPAWQNLRGPAARAGVPDRGDGTAEAGFKKKPNFRRYRQTMGRKIRAFLLKIREKQQKGPQAFQRLSYVTNA